MAYILVDLNKPINLIKLYFIPELFPCFDLQKYLYYQCKVNSKVNRIRINTFNKIHIYILLNIYIIN